MQDSAVLIECHDVLVRQLGFRQCDRIAVGAMNVEFGTAFAKSAFRGTMPGDSTP